MPWNQTENIEFATCRKAKLAVAWWQDWRDAYMVSTMHNLSPTTILKQPEGEHEKKPTPCPATTGDYNKWMGGGEIMADPEVVEEGALETDRHYYQQFMDYCSLQQPQLWDHTYHRSSWDSSQPKSLFYCSWTSDPVHTVLAVYIHVTSEVRNSCICKWQALPTQKFQTWQMCGLQLKNLSGYWDKKGHKETNLFPDTFLCFGFVLGVIPYPLHCLVLPVTCYSIDVLCWQVCCQKCCI